MIADDLEIAKIPSFSTVMTFDGWNLPQEHVVGCVKAKIGFGKKERQIQMLPTARSTFIANVIYILNVALACIHLVHRKPTQQQSNGMTYDLDNDMEFESPSLSCSKSQTPTPSLNISDVLDIWRW